MVCLKQQGYSFAVPRVFRETCQVDDNAVSNLKNAWSAGFKRVEGYIFPSYNHTGCALNATGQVLATVQALRQGNVKFSRLWIDVEGTQWSSDHSLNGAFIDEMAQAIVDADIPVGYYLSIRSYGDILDPWTNKITDAHLWYPHWDNQQNFNDFSPYGGFTQPNRKQYTGGIEICGSKDLVDQSWHPTAAEATMGS
jgi:hypothetical protein